ncbi:integral membrane sensor signal transduction histidine kinase [Tolypothrix tenuis PCC 7101]|uniref:histidine kinase n=1 Tax=Tolypothrix tenuis PCC 7101 TaxID=231146 RepID=A0A1Z4N1G8_9CYAN|nr:HAMP domain-containing protein [Aulosira sp. FACHB-113]BAY99554.1 integral membrane sensor signal transduction histidine kinase [Tolypothrix tenuis PCC 7101]BAZ76521.1 integral membrane sensor signal transduction histidine kinase [Aulosira laxa NIES-50]
MKISHKLILGFLGIASLTGGIGAIAVHQQSQTAKYLARQEAEEVAMLLGYFTNHELEEGKSQSQSEVLSRLQNHVLALHKQRQRDLEIVDRNKIILADIVTEDIGTKLEHDQNNEVGKTIQDGITRTYIETSPEYPQGISLIAVPFKTNQGETIGAVILEYTPLYQAAMAAAQKSIVATSIISLVCGVLALIAGFLISKNISNPIKQLQQAVLNLTEGKLDTRVTIHSQDEIGELATSFNNMANDLQKSRYELLDANEQLQNEITERQQAEGELQETLQNLQKTQAQLIQSEKISSLGQLVAGIAHEINNPVNFIHGNLTYIKEYVESLIDFVQLYQKHYPNPVIEIQAEAENIELEFLQEDLWKILDSMNMGTSRIREIVRSLRNFSRMDEAEYKAVDIHEGIDSTLLILHHRLQAKGNLPEIEVIREYGNLPLIECYAGQLNQVFMNILVNAIDAVEEANTKRSNQQIKDNPSRITIRTSLINSHWVKIAIADTGTGIPETARHNLFNPFFTTKPVNKGTGMGLSISYQIITEKHCGKLEYVSTLGEGTEFIIQIPIRQTVIAAV